MSTNEPRIPLPRWGMFDYLEAVLRRPWIVTVPFLVIVAAVVASSLTMNDMFRSSTLLMVEAETVPDSLVTKTTSNPASRLATITQEILSRTRLEQVIQELNPYPEDSDPIMKIVESMREDVFVRVRGEDAFLVEYVHTEPEMAMKVTNRLATLFIEETTKARQLQAEQVYDFFDDQLTESREKLESSDAELREFKQKYMGALPEQLGSNQGMVQSLQIELQTANQSLQAAESRKIVLEQNLSEERQRVGLPILIPGVIPPTSLDAQRAQLRSELTALQSRYTSHHPDVVRLRAQIRRVDAQIAEEPSNDGETQDTLASAIGANPTLVAIRTQLQDLDLEIRSLRLKRTDTEKEIRSLQARIQATPRVEQELSGIIREFEKHQETYLALLNTHMETQMAQRMEEKWKGLLFRMLDPAFLPERPYYPNRPMYIAGGALIGLFIGIGLALLLEFLDTSVKNARELQVVVPGAVWVTLPHVDPAKKKESAIAEPA